MVHPRDRHLESQNRASANTHSIASTDTVIASTDLFNFIEPLTKGNSTNTSKVTLDKFHNCHIQKFNDDKDQLSKTKKHILKLKKERSELKDLLFQSLTELQMKRLFFLDNEIQKLNNQIQKWEKNDDMTEYFMNTGDILFEYYANLNSISKGDDDRRKRSVESFQPQSDSNESINHTVVDFFRKHKSRNTKSNMETEKNTSTNISNSYSTETNKHQKSGVDTPFQKQKKRTPYMSRQVLLHKYLEYTEPHLVAYNQSYDAGSTSEVDECPDCGTERVLYHHEACLICPNEKCMRADNILVDSNVPAYKDTYRETTSYYSYKRINHFNEWLAQFQAKETTDIPDDVYNQIYMELKKERISNMATITPVKMKEILKRLKLNKYYEHIPHITNRINGQPAPVITRATEEKLRSMFKEIQGPFMKHCPVERKNFLSYSYVLHKFCQLLELDDFLQCFQLLKSREKLHVQDTIWEKICKELRWEFIKSV